MAADSLAAALAAFQAELPAIGKDKAVIVEKKGGGAYGYHYATLGSITNVVAPLLGKHGLSFTSKPTIGANGFVLAYTLRHASGESDSGEYPLPDPVRTTPQMIGSAITYARRYALCAATGVAPDDEEDDDGQAAQAADYQPEVRADGSATEAEQARMNRGPVPGTERIKATEPDSPWYDTPPVEKTPREELPGTASRPQLNKMHALFGQLGVGSDQRERRLELTREIIGHDVQSASALSFVDAQKLNVALDERLKKATPAGRDRNIANLERELGIGAP
jgi:ERF superfamily